MRGRREAIQLLYSNGIPDGVMQRVSVVSCNILTTLLCALCASGGEVRGKLDVAKVYPTLGEARSKCAARRVSQGHVNDDSRDRGIVEEALQVLGILLFES